MHGEHVLLLLGDAHTPPEHSAFRRGVHAGRLAHGLRVDARDVLDGLGRVVLDGLPPFVEAVRVLGNEFFVMQVLGDDRVRERVQERDVAAVVNLHVDVGDARRLDDDDFGALLFRAHNAARDDGVRCARVVPEQEDALRVLQAGDRNAHATRTNCVHQTDDRWAVSSSCTVVYVVRPDASARELLHHVVRLVARTA